MVAQPPKDRAHETRRERGASRVDERGWHVCPIRRATQTGAGIRPARLAEDDQTSQFR